LWKIARTQYRNSAADRAVETWQRYGALLAEKMLGCAKIPAFLPVSRF
jgi:hypothetical protein